MLSQGDIDVYNKISKTPGANVPHALRWYNHIKSFSSDELKQLGISGASPLKAGTTTTAAAKDEDDDDVDLFGSDEEEDAEAAKVTYT